MPAEAELVRTLRDGSLQCRVCEHFCVIPLDGWGRCGVRQHVDGKLILQVYGYPIAVHLDPIEKKPLYHFLPGSAIYSLGTLGCNFRCPWCQNWEISQLTPREVGLPHGKMMTPEEVVRQAQRQGARAIAYTYNEPTVFFEYTLDIARLAREAGLRNVYVSNGFMSREALERLVPYLDAINIDLKGFSEPFYREYCGARLEPVKRNIADLVHNPAVWVEVTTLLIPGLNDSDAELRAAAEWMARVSPDTPWHFSAFFPAYQMLDRPPTPLTTLLKAAQIAREAGMRYVYLGNVRDTEFGQTRCPQCGAVLIQRSGYWTRPLWTQSGRCSACGAALPGVWE